MAEATTAMNEKIGQVADSWAKQFIETRIAVLKRRKIEGSGDLIRSLEYAVATNPGGLAAQMLIAFDGYGRIAEMKRVSHDVWGRNAITRLEDWIQRKGVGNFMPGFLAARGLKTAPQDAINRMAWGIMVNRSQGKFRRRVWYNKAKTAAISDLYNRVAIVSGEAAADAIKEPFKAKEYARAKGRE